MSQTIKLAVDGGKPIRESRLQYGKQTIDDKDIEAVVKFLETSSYLTTGPTLKQFEDVICETSGAKYCSAVSNGSTALHLAMVAIGIKKSDPPMEVIVPAISFAATANCVLYCNGKPVFADVNPENLLVDTDSIISKVTENTKAIIIVDMCGTPAPYEKLWKFCQERDIYLINDAAHSYGVQFPRVGSYCDLTTFSFHPVKNITTGEGGAVVTDNQDLDKRIKLFRNQGIETDYSVREQIGSHYYQITELGFNFRLTDLQAALGLSQNLKIKNFLERRNFIANIYDQLFIDPENKLGITDLLKPLKKPEGYRSAYHLYVIRLNLDKLRVNRNEIFKALVAEGIGCNVHYMPIYYHPLYKDLGYQEGLCPNAEQVYKEIITLPCFPLMTDYDQCDVILALRKVLLYYKK